MIIDVIKGDILQTPQRHIAFAINADAENYQGLAGIVANEYAPLLKTVKSLILGEVISATSNDKTFHGLACHTIEQGGWEDAPRIITAALDKIITNETDIIAVVLIGQSMASQLCGADVPANVRAIHASTKHCIVYTVEFTKEDVLKVIEM